MRHFRVTNMNCRNCGYRLAHEADGYCDNCGAKTKTKNGLGFALNFIVALMVYIAINCFGYFINSIGYVFFIAVILYFCIGLLLKQLNTKLISFVSGSSIFIFGFMMLNMTLLFSIKNETLIFVSRIPLGWVRFMHFDGPVFETLIFNFVITLIPFIFTCIGIHLRWKYGLTKIKEGIKASTVGIVITIAAMTVPGAARALVEAQEQKKPEN